MRTHTCELLSSGRVLPQQFCTVLRDLAATPVPLPRVNITYCRSLVEK